MMEEKILQKKKNGMAMLLLFIILYVAAIVAIIGGIVINVKGDRALISGTSLIVIGIVYAVFGWIPFCGLHVLKPQEAAVLTLFGKYIGSLKGDGFYCVNPFCSMVNPAAETKLNQSGDVKPNAAKLFQIGGVGSANLNVNAGSVDKKISLKIMTLNNNRQKINDCLGNPVEIGIAVMWRVVDTAKAVFNVDNYKEYLSHCAMWSGSILTTPRKMWIPQETGRRMTAVCGVPVRSLRNGSGRKFRIKSQKRDWKLSKPELPIWPMRRRSRR